MLKSCSTACEYLAHSSAFQNGMAYVYQIILYRGLLDHEQSPLPSQSLLLKEENPRYIYRAFKGVHFVKTTVENKRHNSCPFTSYVMNHCNFHGL